MKEKETEINSNTQVKLTIKDAVGLGFVLVSVLSVYFTLKSDIALAMERPKPVITEQEYHYKVLLSIKSILSKVKLRSIKRGEKVFDLKRVVLMPLQMHLFG